MAFAGKWETESQEGYNEFCKLLGIPDDIIEKGRDYKLITEVVQNGNEFSWSQLYPTNKTISNKFVIDQECDMETIGGKKFKVRISMMCHTTFSQFRSGISFFYPGVCFVSFCNIVFQTKAV
uniref:Fatty acid binding protein 6, ileal (gastrotropin) n=1 Tax=Hucho hucho TaxID=62062 RepID=A0A4W5Q9E0_9TELE